MKDLYRKPQAWVFTVTGADVIAFSGDDWDPDPDPAPDFDPSGDDMEW